MKKYRKLTETIKKKIAGEQKWTCAMCSTLLPHTYQIDHIIPFAIGGKDDEVNLQALCPNCHSLKNNNELVRITKFKKLQSNTVNKICWFCLETENDSHQCSKQLQDIDALLKIQHDTVTTFTSLLSKYKYIKPTFSTNLDIHIYVNKVSVNNCTHHFFVEESITLKNIQDAIFLSTRSKSQSNLYTHINIRVVASNDVYRISDFIDYLYMVLNTLVPRRVLTETVSTTIRGI